MEKFVKYFMLVLMVSAMVLAGCSKSDDDEEPTPTPTPSYEVLKNYMVANGLDTDVVIDGWITDAASVNSKGTDAYHIIDLRDADTYNAGHIEGAINSPLGDILDAAAGATKPILVVCFTGQSAGHGTIALRLSGYTDAKVLKWGMAGWNKEFSAPWASNIGDGAAGTGSWVAAPGSITASAEFASPVIETSFTEGADILAERVDFMLANSFQGIAHDVVLADPAAYFINNYWALTDVETYGNITGAYRVQPFTLVANNDINLDPSATVVTYCWTGQTSSMMTAYLTVLGFDAKSLKFGVNSMIYSDLTGHNYNEPGTDYPYITSK